MNGRMMAFCAQYAVLRNTQQAALAAGYSQSYARHESYRLLKHPDVQEQLRYLMERRNELAVLDAATVVNELGAMAMVRPDEFLKLEGDHWVGKEPGELTERQRASVKDIIIEDIYDKVDGRRILTGQKFRYVMHDKATALMKLGEHFGVGKDPDNANRKNPFERMPQAQLEQIASMMQGALEAPIAEGEFEDA